MLKYRFIAQYDDETLFEQNADDVSSVDPTKSAFFDVDQSRLTGFALTDGEHVYAVDLLDGHFEIDGISFKVYDYPVNNRRLIFYRRHRYNFNAEMEEQSHELEYHIGWQGNEVDSNKNIQHTIIIS